MGRPLFSASYSTPAVHTEPEPAPPAIPFEKWTCWNAFDPDSDEFFESADAVYEAFLDPADVQPATDDRVGVGSGAPEPERLDAIIARELAESRSDSSASSEGTISGRGSPMAVGSDDPAGMLVDAYRAGDSFEPRRYGQTQAESEDNERAARNQSPDMEYRSGREDMGMPPLADVDDSALVLINERRVSRVMPPLSPFRSRGFIPHFSVNDLEQDDDHGNISSPSPAPTVTPRLYSWASLGGDTGSPSPRQRPRPGPLTNPSARMSLAHLSPALRMA